MKLFDSYSRTSGNVISTRPRRYKGEVSRVGVFPYYIEGKLLWQLRPPEEVFDQASIDSMMDAVMTVSHPEDDETLDVIHGSVYSVYPLEEEGKIDAEFLLVTATSTKLADSNSPLSPMYDADLLHQPGEYNGRRFDLIQKNIRYSSVGLVDRARQGDSVKVFMQLSKDGLTETTESGIEYIASIITTDDMKVNKKRIADSAAALAEPVAAPAPEATTTIPISVTPGQLSDLAATAPIENEVQTVIPGETEITDAPPAAEVAAPATVETPAETPAEVVAAVEVAEENAEENADEEFVPIAQITTNGGVLVDREYLDQVVSVAEMAASTGAMSLKDAMYYGQANVESVQKVILTHAGLTLSDSDDIGTAYRMYAQNRANPAPVAPTETVKPVTAQTIADAAKAKVVKPPVPQVTRPQVTHPTTHKVADSANGKTAATVEPTDLVTVDMLNI